MKADFTHLHLHSQYSLLDSTIRFDELFEAAVADKMEAVALTDNGNLFGALEFYTQAKEHGIKPIIGCEMYMAPGSRTHRGVHADLDDELAPYETCRSGIHHLNLLCMNETGYQNLCKLVSAGYLEGFYYKPRIDKELLSQHAEGLFATSSCLKGEIAHLCLLGDMDQASEAVRWYSQLFDGRFYLELQQNGLPQQMIINQRYLELSSKLGVPVIATADCHYLKKQDAFSHEVLMAIETGRQVEDPSGSNIRSDEFYFKSQEVMKEEFSFCPQALANTMEIAERCEFEFKFVDEKGKKIYHFPKYDPPAQKTQAEHLCDLAQSGLNERLKQTELLQKREFTEEERAAYQKRLDRELKVINDMGFTGYFLIVSDFIKYAKDHEIPVGPGRGSGAGSLVAYCLLITELDPIHHGLLFERFLNPERVSLPDFDVDFCMDKRDKVIEYVAQKYGKECVAQIITFGKLQARGVIRDVGRAFGLLASDVDKIAKLVPETLSITLEEAFEQEPRLRQLTERDPQMRRLFEICRSLEGLSRHASIHAAGLVISNRPMVEHCPLYRGKNDELVIQFDMNNADRIGLIKFDFLGLKTLTFLEHAEKQIQKRHPEDGFELSRIPLSDKASLEMLARGDTLGVFQLESSGMQDLMKKLRPDAFEDIVASNALYRPGPIGSGMLDDFIGRKHGTVPVVYDLDVLKPILHETYGVIVYQEQVQQIAMALASYTAGSADLLRRAMGKKKPEEMAKQKAIFMEGALKNNYDQAKAEKIFDLMEKFAGYGFNKSHAAAYSLITCQTAYIKAHYPAEFFAALLSIERENTDKITKYISDARRHGIEVLAPDINESDTDFTILSPSQIRFGLGAIKGVGQIAIDCILEARQKAGPFTDLFDLCSRSTPRIVNKRVLEAFVKAGALDGLKAHRSALFKAIDEALELGASLHKIQDANQASFLDLCDQSDTSFSHRKVEYPNEAPWPRLLELKYEKETTGFYLTGHPLANFKKELAQYTCQSIGACLGGGSSKEVLVGACLAALREIITKKGDRMAFATFEDEDEQIEAVIFSDAYLEFESVLKSGAPLWIKAQLEVGEGGNKLILSKKNNARVLHLQYAFEVMARELHLHVDVNSIEAKLKQLSAFLQSVQCKPGNGVFLHLGGASGRTRTILRMRETIALTRENVERIQGLFNDPGASIEFR